MFWRKGQISAAERTRLLDFLLFRLKQGGNVHAALKTYMDGNEEKRSRPVGTMLARMTAGESFAVVAKDIGFLNDRGAVLVDNAPNPYLALKSIQEMNAADQGRSVSWVWLSTILKHWLIALGISLTLTPFGANQTLTAMYKNSAEAAISLGATPREAPFYVQEPWIITEWVLIGGVVIFACWLALRLVAAKRVDLLYRIFRFRFFEDWGPLLDIYLALKRAGHSDSQAARVIAVVTQQGFIHQLFSLAADNLRMKGKGLYETFSSFKGVIPVEVLGYLMDGEKTGQRDVYVARARDFCVHTLGEMHKRATRWVPTIVSNVNIVVFGLLLADLTLDIVNVMIKPLIG